MRLEEAVRSDGRPFVNFKTYAVMVDDKRIGTIQHSTSGEDDGRRYAWLSDGVEDKQFLGVFITEALALKAITKESQGG